MKKTKQREILAKWVNAAQHLEGRDGNSYFVQKPMGLGPEVEPMKPLPEQWKVYSSTVPNPDIQKPEDKICVEHTEESSKQYDEFMDEYYKQHECCPKCGATEHTSTLVGYVLNWDKKEEYKNMNRCECMECGDKHSTHDRVPSNEALP